MKRDARQKKERSDHVCDAINYNVCEPAVQRRVREREVAWRWAVERVD